MSACRFTTPLGLESSRRFGSMSLPVVGSCEKNGANSSEGSWDACTSRFLPCQIARFLDEHKSVSGLISMEAVTTRQAQLGILLSGPPSHMDLVLVPSLTREGRFTPMNRVAAFTLALLLATLVASSPQVRAQADPPDRSRYANDERDQYWDEDEGPLGELFFGWVGWGDGGEAWREWAKDRREAIREGNKDRREAEREWRKDRREAARESEKAWRERWREADKEWREAARERDQRQRERFREDEKRFREEPREREKARREAWKDWREWE